MAAPSRKTASHLVTVGGRDVTAEVLSAVLHRLVSVATTVCGSRTMATHPCTVLELAVRLSTPRDHAEAALRVALAGVADQNQVDIAVLRPGRHYRLVVFDVDSALVRNAAGLGSAPPAEEPAATTAEARARLSSLLTPGTMVALRVLRSLGIKVGAVAGGPSAALSDLAKALRLDFVVTAEPAAKAAALRRLAAARQVPLVACAAVGGADDDVELLRAAGLGVAFCAPPEVAAAADVAVSCLRLDLVLPMLGIPVPCAQVR